MKRKKWLLLLLLAVVIVPLAYIRIWYVRIPMASMKESSKKIARPAVIAHRGASFPAPEETEPAYLLARDFGVDYLELDIQRTKDHALVAFHDDTLERTTNAAQVFPGREKGSVAEFTLDELKQLDAGSWFNQTYPKRARPKYAGVKILTLDEIITLAESGTNKPSLYMETKSPGRHPGYEDEIVEVLTRRGWLGSFDSGLSKSVFQSFSLSSLKRLKELAPEVPRIYLIGDDMPREEGWKKLIEDAKQNCQGIGPVGLIAWPWNVAKAHRAALHVHVYTVDPPLLFPVGNAFGLDGFFTNRCDKLMQYYDKPLSSPAETILQKYGY